jgi:hypothetical protein
MSHSNPITELRHTEPNWQTEVLKGGHKYNIQYYSLV